MTPLWRSLSAALALVAGFAIPIFLLLVYLGVKQMGPVAITGLVALAGAVTLLVLVGSGRLRF